DWGEERAECLRWLQTGAGLREGRAGGGRRHGGRGRSPRAASALTAWLLTLAADFGQSMRAGPSPPACSELCDGLQLQRRRVMARLRIVFLMLAAGLAAAVAPAQEYSAGAIKVSRVWTRETPAGANVAAGFLTITNSGKEADTLIGGSIPFAG